MTTKQKAVPKPVQVEEQSTTEEEVLNTPVIVEAFGRKYEIQRFSVGQMLRALPYISPIGYLLISSQQADNATIVARLLVAGGEPAAGLVSVAISEPVEWIEEQNDPIGALELLTATVEKNARYFFEPKNVERIKAAFGRLQSLSRKHGGVISTPSSDTDTDH